MSFESEVRAAAKRINRDVETVQRKIVQQLFESVVRLTPADTGRLRGAWQISKGAPASGVPSRLGMSGPLSEIKAKVRKPANYWLVNNLPYSLVAEYGKWGTGESATEKTTRDGYSIQAPNGMVRVNLVRIRGLIRRLGFK